VILGDGGYRTATVKVCRSAPAEGVQFNCHANAEWYTVGRGRRRYRRSRPNRYVTSYLVECRKQTKQLISLRAFCPSCWTDNKPIGRSFKHSTFTHQRFRRNVQRGKCCDYTFDPERNVHFSSVCRRTRVRVEAVLSRVTRFGGA